MADVYDLVQKILAKNQGSGRNQFYDPTADFAMEIPKIIQNQQGRKEQAEMQRFRDQNAVANQFNNTVSRFMSTYQNPDGTLSNENIGNLRKQIDTLRFQYEKQFPNSIELLGTTEDIFNSKLSQMEKDNVRYDNMNFEMNKMMGDEEGSLGSMLDKYSGLTEEYVLNNREELINELSQMTSRLGDYNKDFSRSGFNSRVGSGDLTGNMSKANTIIKSLQQQLLDIDSMSPNKIITDKERLAFTQYLENDNSDLLNEIISENKAGIKNKKKQTFEAIEKNLSDYAYADSIMNLDSNKDFIESGSTLRDGTSDEKDTGLTFSEWEQKKDDAYDELHMGKFDEKLKNLYASGTGYMDLYSDRPAAKIINQFDDLKPLFGIVEQQVEIKTPLPSPPSSPPSSPPVSPPVSPPSPASNVVGDTPQNAASSHIDSFLNLPSSKHGNFVDSKTSKEFKENLMDSTGWSSGGANRGIQRLKAIRRLNNELQMMKEKGAQDIVIRRKEEQIKNKKDEYLKWSNTSSIFASFEDKLPNMKDKEIQDFIDSKPKGQAAKRFTQDRNKAIAELKSRENKDVVKKDSPQATDEKSMKDEWNSMTQTEKDSLGVKTYDEFADFAKAPAQDTQAKPKDSKNPYNLTYDDYRDWLESEYQRKYDKSVKEGSHMMAQQHLSRLNTIKKDRQGGIGSVRDFNIHSWNSDDKHVKARVQKWINKETKRRQNK